MVAANGLPGRAALYKWLSGIAGKKLKYIDCRDGVPFLKVRRVVVAL
jgi:hypothetical protein